MSAGITFQTCILLVFLDIWEKEEIPAEWKIGIIVKIPKKGDLSNCQNKRGYAQLAVFSRVMLNRMVGKVDVGIRREQTGFQPNRSSIDQISLCASS
jgi:hypothetical protein